MVTQEELDWYLHTKGWYLVLRSGRNTGKLYAYTKRRRGPKVIAKYLWPLDKVDALDEATVDRKLLT